ncbi:hypothetical protein V6Z11_D07G211900 [Gossypium hirsutum]
MFGPKDVFAILRIWISGVGGAYEMVSKYTSKDSYTLCFGYKIAKGLYHLNKHSLSTSSGAKHWKPFCTNTNKETKARRLKFFFPLNLSIYSLL